MKKKEQQIFLDKVSGNLRDNGIMVGWFLKQVKISATHWFFMKKGDRELTDEKKKIIVSFLKQRLIYQS